MLGVGVLKSSLKEIWSHKVDYFFMFFQLLYFSRLIRFTFSDSYLILHLAISFFFVLFSGRLKKIISLTWVLIIFVLISLLPIILFDFSATLYGGYAIRLIIAFLIAIYFGNTFLIYFENIVYVLAFISIPLFIIQLTVPEIFNVFNRLTQQILHYEGIGTGSSYFLVFFLNGSAQFRNSGFLSEPSFYGIVLAWASLINVYIHNFKLNNKLIVFILAMLTTFSVGTYIYLLLLLILFFKNSFYQNFYRRAVSIAAVFITLFFIFKDASFVTDNFAMMDSKIEAEERHQENYELGKTATGEVSRVLGARININTFFKWPFGIGLVKKGHVQYGLPALAGGSPNGLSNLIVTWGLGFVIILFLSARKLTEILQFHLRVSNRSYHYKADRITQILTIVLFIIPLSGYSLFNQPFMLALLLWPILFAEETKRIERKLLSENLNAQLW